MKPTFLNQTRPLITAMVLKSTPDAMRFTIKNSIFDGADALGVQLERLTPEFKAPEHYRSIFAAAGQRPIYVTNYRHTYNKGLTDERCMEELLRAMACGGTLADVMGDTYDPGADLELTMKGAAVARQMELIDRLHAMGKEVLMSSHVMRYIAAEQVLEIAFEQQRRGADIVKIVTAANTDEEQMENLRITSLLKRELSVPFLFLSGGTHSKIHRMIGPMLGCVTYLAVWQHDECAVPTQPTVKNAKQVRDHFDYLPDTVIE